MGDTSTNGAKLAERLPTIRELLGSVNTSAFPGLTPINGTKSTGWALCGRVTAAPPRPAIPKRWATTRDLGPVLVSLRGARIFGICRVGAILVDVG